MLMVVLGILFFKNEWTKFDHDREVHFAFQRDTLIVRLVFMYLQC
jgi:hypothetical protein